MVGIKSGWTKWNYEECLEKNKDLWFKPNALNVNLNKSKFMVIDLDDKQYQNEYMDKYGGEFQSFSTRLKMPHLWRLKSNNDLNTTKVKFKAGLDLLYHNTFEDINGDILNTNGDLKTFLDFPEVKKIIKKNVSNS